LALAAHFRPRVARADLRVYPEQLDPEPIRPDVPIRLGSSALFLDLHARMRAASDVLVYVHGFNVSWSEAVASAAALQLMLNLPLEARVLPAGTPQAGTPQAASRGAGERAGSALAPTSAPSSPSSPVQVVLFSWPSDGRLLPFVSYRSDRTEAEGSGFALARGLLKLRDFLATLRDESGARLAPCGRNIHLLCHSMGAFVLQSALARLSAFTPGSTMPRLFDQILLCAPDVDDNVLERGQPLQYLHELARNVTIYHHPDDRAMQISDLTKGHAERLGSEGCARPAIVHNKVHQVHCGATLADVPFAHGYHLAGLVNHDIRCTLAGLPVGAVGRDRCLARELPNVWQLMPR
ncbi:MAG: alpha/beta hydrolase, partial [Gammaproteobacteria bacterium]